MSTFVTKCSEVPKAPFYVRARDTFLSGWGRSEGRPNYVLLPCTSYAEAEIVLANTRARSDMADARIVKHVPRLVTRDDVTVSLFDREDAARWYRKGGFDG